MIAELRPVLASLVLRTTVLWIVARAALTVLNRAAAGIIPGGPPPPSGLDNLSIAVPTAVLLAGVVALLVLSDVRALRERTFLANLGVSRRAIAGVAFSVALVIEGLVAMTLEVLG